MVSLKISILVLPSSLLVPIGKQHNISVCSISLLNTTVSSMVSKGNKEDLEHTVLLHTYLPVLLTYVRACLLRSS